jgi:hypothetical protein
MPGAPSTGLAQNYETYDLVNAVAERMKEIIVQELYQSWFWWWMLKNASWVDCHKEITFNAITDIPEQGQWVGSRSRLGEQGLINPKMLKYNNRYMAVPITINTLVMMEEEGNPQALWNMLEWQSTMAAIGKNRRLSNCSLNHTGDPLGMTGLIGGLLGREAEGAQTTSVGGYSRATNAWWEHRSYALTSNFGSIAAGTTLPAGILAILEIIDRCTIGRNLPSFAMGTKNIFKNIRRTALEMFSGHYMVKDKNSAEIGFDSVMIDGISFGWDYYMPANTLVLLDVKGKSKTDQRFLGDNKENNWDADIENATVKLPIQLANGGIFGIRNPRCKNLSLGPQQEFRGFGNTRWLLDSLNFGMGRSRGCGVLYSAGSELETWA